MAKSVLHPLGMSSKLLEDSSYLNWKCHVTNLLLQVTYLAPHVCPYWEYSDSIQLVRVFEKKWYRSDDVDLFTVGTIEKMSPGHWTRVGAPSIFRVSVSVLIFSRVSVSGYMWNSNCKIAQAFFLLSCRGLGLGVNKLMGVSHVSNFLLGTPKNLLLPK